MTFLEQHLSDEAVAACADGVLGGAAQDRAARHIATCAECAQAVRGQREAVWALRAAPAPPLPSHLLARLRDVPQTTPLRALPPVVTSDSSGLLGGYAPMAGFTPTTSTGTGHLGRTIAMAAAAVALTGALTAGAVVMASHADEHSPGLRTGGSGGSAPQVPQSHLLRQLHP